MNFEQEITVEVNVSYECLHKILEKNNFKVLEEYDLIDYYMIRKDYPLTLNHLETLKQCVLLRQIIEENKKTFMLTYKYKEYNSLGEIIKQGKVNCAVESAEKAKKLFEMLGYYKLIELRDHIIVYANESTEICVQLVNGKHIYIELEEKSNHVNKIYNNIDEMKEEISKYQIPIKNNNYFVKKAEIELKEILENTKYIGQTLEIKIDRKFGSKHPKHGFIYPVNYGYVPNTISGDGEELDCYLLGVFEPVKEYKGKCIAVIHRTNDNDDKLIIAPEDKEYSNVSIDALTEFQEKYFEHIIIR